MQPTKLLYLENHQQYEAEAKVYIPAGKPARVVMYGAIGIPCGGTHVANLSEIRHLTIRKIKKEKEQVKVSYDVAR